MCRWPSFKRFKYRRSLAPNSADAIDKVEVITNHQPVMTLKVERILNIILKKVRIEVFNGSFASLGNSEPIWLKRKPEL
jgi:hypothetical protein